jgi:hypothetical protein
MWRIFVITSALMGLVGAAQEMRPNVKPRLEKAPLIKRPPTEAPYVPGQFREIDQTAQKWDRRFGPRMTQLMQKKALATKRLADLVKRISKSDDVNMDERKFQVLSMEMFAKELNETEKMIVQAMQWLESVLKGDYKVAASFPILLAVF